MSPMVWCRGHAAVFLFVFVLFVWVVLWVASGTLAADVPLGRGVWENWAGDVVEGDGGDEGCGLCVSPSLWVACGLASKGMACT